MKKRIIFFIIPVVIGVLASATGFSLLWRLFILSLAVPLFGYLWTLLSLRGIRGESAELPAKSTAGETIKEKFVLTNSQKLPKWLLTVRENTDIPGHTNIQTVNLAPRASRTLESSIHFTRRGQFTSGKYTATSGDPLGMFTKSQQLGTPHTILVYPRAIDLPFFDPLTHINQGYGPGRWLASQISPNVASIREYMNGDSLRHIHWNTTAHSSRLMVKVFDPDRSHSSARTIWVIPDMNESVQAGEGEESTEEYIVTIAASILKKYAENSWPVGLITSAEKNYTFQLETGSQHLENMETALATMRAAGKASIEQLIASEASRFDLNSMSVVITPAWNERMVSALLQIRRQQGVVVAILLDSRSFGANRGTPSIPASLMQNGVQVYIIKKGDNLSAILDSRKI